MTNVLDAVEPVHRAVIEEELGHRAPALLEALSSANKPTIEQSDALMDIMISAMGEHCGPGHIPDERGVAIDNAVGGYLLAWPDQRINLNEFVVQAGRHGPCVAVLASSPTELPADVELRAVDGARITSFDALLEEFARAWQFPSWFRPNPNAFNDFMRDLDGMIDVAYGRPPAPGYLTEIVNAHLLLAEDPETFRWFADHIRFYRDYYRDEASPTASFGLLLSAPVERLDEVRARWVAAGADIAIIG